MDEDDWTQKYGGLPSGDLGGIRFNYPRVPNEKGDPEDEYDPSQYPTEPDTTTYYMDTTNVNVHVGTTFTSPITNQRVTVTGRLPAIGQTPHWQVVPTSTLNVNVNIPSTTVSVGQVAASFAGGVALGVAATAVTIATGGVGGLIIAAAGIGAAVNTFGDMNSHPENYTPQDVANYTAGALGGIVGGAGSNYIPGVRVGAPNRTNGVSTTTTESNGGLETRGFHPPQGTRQIPRGIPESWRIRPTRGEGGVRYYDPNNRGNSVRVMPGDPESPFANSRRPYVRWQRNGQPLDENGNELPTKNSPDAHIPLKDFRFNPEVLK